VQLLHGHAGIGIKVPQRMVEIKKKVFVFQSQNSKVKSQK
jgi:hypothetical protein